MAIEFAQFSVWRVTAIGRFNDESEVRNVYELSPQLIGTLTEAQGLADIEEWLLVILNILKTIQSIKMVWRGFSVSELDGDQNTGELAFSGGDIDGDVGTGDVLPAQVAMLSFMNTGLSRRQLRKYWNGLVEAENDANGLITSATAAAISGIGTHLMSVYSATVTDWLYGKWNPGDYGSGAFPISFVTSLNPSTQRRRRVGRGI